MGLLMMNGVPYSGVNESEDRYSFEDKEVGTWLDGKPLYKKTILGYMPEVVTEGTFVSNLLDCSDLHVDMVADLSVVVDQNPCYIKLPYTNNSGLQSKSFYDENNNGIILWTNTPIHSQKMVYATMWYTKTTDLPCNNTRGYGEYRRRYYRLIGEFVKSTTQSTRGYGVATIDLIGDIARIDYTFHITNYSGTSDDFNWGISVNALRQLSGGEMPYLYPMQGGWFWTNQNNNAELLGYGSMWSPTNLDHRDDLYWLPARAYTQQGDVGGWPSNMVRQSGLWMGCCFGCLTP